MHPARHRKRQGALPDHRPPGKRARREGRARSCSGSTTIPPEARAGCGRPAPRLRNPLSNTASVARKLQAERRGLQCTRCLRRPQPDVRTWTSAQGSTICGQRHGSARTPWPRSIIIGMRAIGTTSRESLFFRMLIILAAFLICTCQEKKKAVIEGQYPVLDEVTHLLVYPFVDVQPKYVGGDESLTKDFLSAFHHDFQKDDRLQTSTCVVFVIDSVGTLLGERIKGKKESEHSLFEQDVLKAFSTLQSWSCGFVGGKAVNVISSYPIHIDPRNSPSRTHNEEGHPHF